MPDLLNTLRADRTDASNAEGEERQFQRLPHGLLGQDEARLDGVLASIAIDGLALRVEGEAEGIASVQFLDVREPGHVGVGNDDRFAESFYVPHNASPIASLDLRLHRNSEAGAIHEYGETPYVAALSSLTFPHGFQTVAPEVLA